MNVLHQMNAPWVLHEQGDANHYCLLTPEKQWIMAFQLDGGIHTPRQLEIAKLFTASPELLQAAINLITYLGHDWGEDEMVVQLKEAVEKAAGNVYYYEDYQGEDEG